MANTDSCLDGSSVELANTHHFSIAPAHAAPPAIAGGAEEEAPSLQVLVDLRKDGHCDR
jgi:hypothetical protein